MRVLREMRGLTRSQRERCFYRAQQILVAERLAERCVGAQSRQAVEGVDEAVRSAAPDGDNRDVWSLWPEARDRLDALLRSPEQVSDVDSRSGRT